jgi:bifunctional DNA-binding transcriptional regulator/antitoxin component of YhaV-PrlF toxin-antitoxin module
MKLQFTGKQYQITVPKKLVEAKNWEKGEELKWELNDNGNLELRESE